MKTRDFPLHTAGASYHVIVIRKLFETILCILQDITRYECSRSNLLANLFPGLCCSQTN